MDKPWKLLALDREGRECSSSMLHHPIECKTIILLSFASKTKECKEHNGAQGCGPTCRLNGYNKNTTTSPENGRISDDTTIIEMGIVPAHPVTNGGKGNIEPDV